MKYMLLIFNDPALEPSYGTPEFDTMMSDFFAANEKMKADGVLCGGEGLQGIETATSLRIKAGKVETMDGPFAETREHLGGYYVIDTADLDSALSYAALIPSANFGTIEVRPLMDYNPAGN
ncbi:YciI family protein [Maritalea porphyrae]|jgi:hypothetical protein|uniref:YciI family protein n=1 Tax=Maritalea porphyrae TaxID=880732 RepID=UPI0022AEC790|nr:YciI family protein [Maritalea porphyrae]MCZ4271373.1 YciI family protein [Maritalea porphyrae]